jgi:hypothetical protein
MAAGNSTLTCPKSMAATSNGVFQGDSPVHFALPLLILQICLVLVLTRAIGVVLKRLRQPRVIAEIIVRKSSSQIGSESKPESNPNRFRIEAGIESESVPNRSRNRIRIGAGIEARRNPSRIGAGIGNRIGNGDGNRDRNPNRNREPGSKPEPRAESEPESGTGTGIETGIRLGIGSRDGIECAWNE